MNIKHSIVIICYNQENFIERALESALYQTRPPSELLIVDDCSIDETLKRAQQYLEVVSPIFPCRVISNNKNLGIPGNIKNACLIATGNVITILSGDDILHTSTIERTNAAIVKSNLNPDEDSFVAFMPTQEVMALKTILIKYSVYLGSPFKTMLRKY